MRLPGNPSRHLTYCLNIHPGESLEDVRAAIATHAAAVKRRVAPQVPFGVGLRLGAVAAAELGDPSALAALRRLLDDHDLYAFTINGFPFGRFHKTRVKAQVYLPDWRDAGRLDYTVQLAHILASLLPEDVTGSISTVPLGYKPLASDPVLLPVMTANLARCAVELDRIRLKHGRTIVLALEPEPDCLLERTDEVIHYFNTTLLRDGAGIVAEMAGCGTSRAEALLRTHIGICLDACHAAVEFEEPAAMLRALHAEGIRIPKIQVSAALETDAGPAAEAALRPFVDMVYLHQTRMVFPNGSRLEFPDLDDAVFARLKTATGGLARVHFHVPLFYTGSTVLRSTSRMTAELLRYLHTTQIAADLEVETYTFSVLPPDVAGADVDSCIVGELNWTLNAMDANRRS